MIRYGENKREATPLKKPLMSAAHYCFFFFLVKGADVSCKWNLDVDGAVAASVLEVYLYSLDIITHVWGNLVKRVHTPPMCIQWKPEARITHNGGIFKSWLHILPSFFVLFDWGGLPHPPPNPLGACTPIYVNPLYIPQLHLEAPRLHN